MGTAGGARDTTLCWQLGTGAARQQLWWNWDFAKESHSVNMVWPSFTCCAVTRRDGLASLPVPLLHHDAIEKKLPQGQMCWVLAAECGCCYEGPRISSLDLDFFPEHYTNSYCVFPFSIFPSLITLIALFSWQVDAIKTRHQIQRETGSIDLLGRLLRAPQPSYETPLVEAIWLLLSVTSACSHHQ